jgi:hypothetical protein
MLESVFQRDCFVWIIWSLNYTPKRNIFTGLEIEQECTSYCCCANSGILKRLVGPCDTCIKLIFCD